KNPLEQLINIQNVRGALEYRLDKKIQESEEDTLFKEFSLSQIVPSAKKQTLFIQVDRMKRKLLYSSESLETNFSHWILKVPAKNDISSSSKIEYAYSLMAKKAGLNIPNSYLFRTQTKHSYFGVQRFDRDTDNNSFHIHSLGGLIHSDAKLSSLDYDDFLSITLTLTKNVKDLQKAFRVVCFNILSHNKDDNQNNLIFIMDMLGDWHLAPASNLTFSYGNSGKHHMKVMGENSWIRINHLIKLAKSHDIRNYQEILDEVSSAISSWTSFAKIANVPQEESLKIETILNKINLSF
ncbi:MAG: HipA domain-containing protein, partial [Campylobacterota bacterium]|nr:HipA domain-containing protein [Campylobacterota bacterium]